MSYLTKLALGIIFVIPVSCQSQVTDSSDRPTWTSVYKPPAIYETWWSEIAQCESLPLPEKHQNVVWRLVPVRPFRLRDDSTHLNVDGDAATVGDVDEIFINYSGVLDEGLIKHEQLHKLLYWKNGNKVPVPDHPDPYYKQCGMVQYGQQKL